MSYHRKTNFLLVPEELITEYVDFCECIGIDFEYIKDFYSYFFNTAISGKQELRIYDRADLFLFLRYCCENRLNLNDEYFNKLMKE